jgi:MFS family permease
MKSPLPPALRHRDFRLFWSGAVLSGVGSQFTTVAMAWQIYQLTNSPLQIGLLGLGRALPQIGLALVGGLLADAVDRRRLMMAIQIGELSISAMLAGLTFSGAISPTYLFVAAVLLAFGSALETPPRQAIVPNLVTGEDLSSAIALNNAQRSVGTIIGPSLAGVVLAVSGPGPCYIVDAISWLAMFGALALLRWRPIPMNGTGRLGPGALLAGLRFVLHQRVIFSFMVLDFGATFFGSTNALLPVFARDILAAGPIALGLLYASSSVGAVITAAVMSTRPALKETGKWVLLGVAFYSICVIVFAFSDALWLSVVMLAGTGVGNMVSSVLRGTTNQLLTPDHLRGRVAAVNSAFVMGGPQLGQFESGVVADLFSAPVSAATGGIGALVLVLGIALVPGVWRFRLAQQVAITPASGGPVKPSSPEAEPARTR